MARMCLQRRAYPTSLAALRLAASVGEAGNEEALSSADKPNQPGRYAGRGVQPWRVSTFASAAKSGA
jgi:hypothetical protein